MQVKVILIIVAVTRVYVLKKITEIVWRLIITLIDTLRMQKEF